MAIMSIGFYKHNLERCNNKEIKNGKSYWEQNNDLCFYLSSYVIIILKTNNNCSHLNWTSNETKTQFLMCLMLLEIIYLKIFITFNAE